jgi:DNA-binding MarR family transcriptional regulator
METRYSEFTKLISKINKSISKIKSQEMVEFGLKGNYVQCIYYLSLEKNGLTLTKLCEFCDEDKAAISRTIKELESKGLIFEDKKPEQKYKNKIMLTETGKNIARAINDKIESIWETASPSTSKAQKDLFYQYLNDISANLQKFCENYGENNG